mmetsp:Transcript_77289/g.202805  ORF Transcript_77289/g.202805 Transcript_77289/m.202805 type:complete len:467 (-) Transcript_77289:265-1665(-)
MGVSKRDVASRPHSRAGAEEPGACGADGAAGAQPMSRLFIVFAFGVDRIGCVGHGLPEEVRRSLQADAAPADSRAGVGAGRVALGSSRLARAARLRARGALRRSLLRSDAGRAGARLRDCRGRGPPLHVSGRGRQERNVLVLVLVLEGHLLLQSAGAGHLEILAVDDLAHLVQGALPRAAAGGVVATQGFEGPASPHRSEELPDDQTCLLTSAVHVITDQLCGRLVRDACVGLPHQAERAAADGQHQEDAIHLLRDLGEVDGDELVVAREAIAEVAGMLHAAHPVGEGVHGAEDLSVLREEDRRDLHVNLLLAHGPQVPADADGEPRQLGGLGQARAGALLHHERDLLDFRRVRDLLADQVADGGLQDVQEMGPALRRLVDLEERPSAVELELHHGDDVGAAVVAGLELEGLHGPALFQQNDLAVVDLVQIPVVVHGDDEDHELYMRHEVLQFYPDLLVVAIGISS